MAKRSQPKPEKSGNQMVEIAARRLEDAWVLYRTRRYVGALYMGGYHIECMLKWALTQRAGEEYKPKNYSGAGWHDFERMASEASFYQALTGDPNVKTWWSVIKQWDVAWRYETKVPAYFPQSGDKLDKAVSQWLRSVEEFGKWLTNRS